MAIVVTSLGTNSNKSSADPWTPFSNITLAAAEMIFLCVAADDFNVTSVKWNNIVMSEDIDAGNTTLRIRFFSYYSSGGGTGDIVIDYGTFVPVAMAATLYKASGLSSSAQLDKTAIGTGDGTDALTGYTGVLSQADEVIIVASAVEDEVDDAHGAWTAGADYVSDNVQFNATNGGGDASNIQVHSATRIVTTTATMRGVDAGHDSSDWAACIASYKMAAAGGPTLNAYNKILYTSEPPTPNAWNQVKQEAGAGWKKLLYV